MLVTSGWEADSACSDTVPYSHVLPTLAALAHSQPAMAATSASLQALPLATGGKPLPTVGLGTWKSAPGEVKAAVLAALAAGYTHIDCAAIYGNEVEVGAALQQAFTEGVELLVSGERRVLRREDLFITSKLWVSRTDDAAAALQQTLADLQLAYLDLYLIHWPFFIRPGASFPLAPEARLGYDAEAYLAVWRQLEALHGAGLTRAIGVSNMTVKKLKALLPNVKVPIANNQVEMHPFLPQQALVDFCKENGITVTAYSPLGSPDRPGAAGSSAPAPLQDAIINGIAKAHGVTAGQVLLRWGLQRGTVVIPKSVTPARIAANADLYTFELSEEEMVAIAKLGEKPVRLIEGAFCAPAGVSVSMFWDGESA